MHTNECQSRADSGTYWNGILMNTEKALLLDHLLSLSGIDLRAELIGIVGESQVAEWEERIHSFMCEGSRDIAPGLHNSVYAYLPTGSDASTVRLCLTRDSSDREDMLVVLYAKHEYDLESVCCYYINRASIDSLTRLQLSNSGITTYYANEWRYLSLRVVAHICVRLLC